MAHFLYSFHSYSAIEGTRGVGSEGMSKIHVRRHCSCPYCGEKIEIVINPETPYGMQVWTRKRGGGKKKDG